MLMTLLGFTFPTDDVDAFLAAHEKGERCWRGSKGSQEPIQADYKGLPDSGWPLSICPKKPTLTPL